MFALYKLLGTPEQVAAMRANYEGRNYGYGHAKQALYDLIVESLQRKSTIHALYEQP